MKRLRLGFAVSAAAVLSLITPAQFAFASLSPADYIGQGIDHYGPDDILCSSGSLGSLVGNSDTEKALNFMLQNGFTIAGASGVIGNWMQESGVRSDIIQGGKTADNNYEMVPGVGFGLAQWTSGGRQKSLAAFAEKNNLPITDFSLQLNFFLKEFKEGYSNTYDTVTKESDPVQAAIDFHDGYESSADSAATVKNVRGGNAQKVYDKYKDMSSASTSGSSSSSACGDRQPAGKVVWYSQLDPKWAKSTYAGDTIANVGCGPTSMAIILASLVDKNITPPDVAAVAGEQNGGTSSHANLIAGVNKKWGLNISTNSLTIDQAIEFVNSGKGYVWVGGTGDAPFTKSGHLVAMVGVTSSGQITIADPFGDGPGHQHIASYPKSQIQADASTFYGVPKP